MKILNFIACMMLPISIINSGYTMDDENTGIQNPIHFVNDNNNNFINNNNLENNNNDLLENNNDNNLLQTCININRNSVNTLKVSSIKNDIKAKYETLTNEIAQLSCLLSSKDKHIMPTEIINIINNMFNDINNGNKNINILSMKDICDKYDKSNTIYNNIKDINVTIEHNVIQLIKNLSNYFTKYISFKKDIDNIDEITKELTNKINDMIGEIINSNNKYNGAKAKVIVDKDQDKRNKLAKEAHKIKQQYNTDKKEIFKLLKLSNDNISEEFIHDILKNLYKSNEIITTFYEILINDNYVVKSYIADDIYNNVIYQGLDYSNNIVTCLKNILRIKNEMKQLWDNFANKEKNKNKIENNYESIINIENQNKDFEKYYIDLNDQYNKNNKCFKTLGNSLESSSSSVSSDGETKK